MEALRLLRQSGLVPRRTIRAVLFTGEEYGLAGAKAYHRRHGREHHVAAFETDYTGWARRVLPHGAARRRRLMIVPTLGRIGATVLSRRRRT